MRLMNVSSCSCLCGSGFLVILFLIEFFVIGILVSCDYYMGLCCCCCDEDMWLWELEFENFGGY